MCNSYYTNMTSHVRQYGIFHVLHNIIFLTTAYCIMPASRACIEFRRGFCTLVLFILVAAVNSESYPRFEFRGDVLVNNSYIVRGDPVNIGEGPNDSLHCVTDNSDCCSNGEGNWYDETGGEVHQGSDGDIDRLYVARGDGVVYLNRRERGGSSGMWRCDIPDSNGIYSRASTSTLAFLQQV